MVIESKRKRYQRHYAFPAGDSVVIPLVLRGDEVLCDVRWENDNGELKELHGLMFVIDNLAPLNEMIDHKLVDIWKHYYPDNP